MRAPCQEVSHGDPSKEGEIFNWRFGKRTCRVLPPSPPPHGKAFSVGMVLVMSFSAAFVLIFIPEFEADGTQ